MVGPFQDALEASADGSAAVLTSLLPVAEARDWQQLETLAGDVFGCSLATLLAPVLFLWEHRQETALELRARLGVSGPYLWLVMVWLPSKSRPTT